MKTCNRCKETKELSEFGKDKTKKDGARTICKDCDRKREQNLKTSHLAKLEKAVTSCTITTNRILFQEDKRICCQCNNIFSIYSSQRYSCKKCYHENAKKYSKENKEKIAEQQKEYYEKNREKVNEYHKKYYEKNKEKIREKKKEYNRQRYLKLKEGI